jgi:hypothetical protein
MSAAVVERTPDDGRLLVRPPTLVRRRPVLSFVGLLALVCVVLAGVGRSGVIAPQAEVRHTGSLGDGTASYAPTYSLVNHGVRPIEVEAVVSPGAVGLAPKGGIDLSDPNRPIRLTVDDVPAFAPFTLAGGAGRTLVVDLPCADVVAGTVVFEVRIRSADSGLRRTLTEVVGDPLVCP